MIGLTHPVFTCHHIVTIRLLSIAVIKSWIYKHNKKQEIKLHTNIEN